MKKKVFNEFVETYKDFPKNGIFFKDILPLLRKPDVFENLINEMSSFKILKNAEAIIGVDARGFVFGTALALKLKKPLILARKPGKLPGEIITFNYDLEYGENSLSIQKNAIKDFNSFAIVDDLLATGGTVESVSKILYSQKKTISGLAVVIELQDLKGRSRFNFPTQNILSF
tara:strand:- start:818 stop:1336 length:519 start_codon:yes stop_codon:yes gene_type:complete